MKNDRKKKIASKVTSKVAVGLLIVFTALIIIVAFSIRNDLAEKTQDKLTLLSTENANVAREFMESLLNQQTVLINTIKNLRDVDDAQKVRMLSKIISDTKEENSDELSLFFVAEPNAFIKDSPNGYSIFSSKAGTKSEPEMFNYINKNLYEQIKNEKRMAVVDPFSKNIDGKEYMVITVILPIFNQNNEFVGIVGSNIDSELLNNANYNYGGFSSAATQIICGHKTVITDSKFPESIGKSFLDTNESKNPEKILDTANLGEPQTFIDTNTDNEKYYKSYIPFYIKGSDVVWISGTNITEAEFNADIFKQIAFIAIWLIIGFLLLVVFTYICIDKSLRPISKLEEAVKELSQGNLHFKLDYNSNDELGSLADNLRTSTSILYSYIMDIDRAMTEMAGGNFNLGASQPFIGDFQNIEVSINKFIHTMSSTLYQIRMAADQVSAGSIQVSDGAQSLAQSATQQASSVDLLSTELSEVSTHIKITAGNASGVNELAGVVGEKIHTSNERMIEMSTAINEISKSSEEIGKIIKTIEDIAFQTNILALNAAVEAARAGAAGKGFAVVADEVRNLANKSSEAAKQTGLLIEESVNSVKNGVEIAHETADSLVEVVTGADEIVSLIEEISKASDEQTESIAEITTGVDQISSVVQTNSATSQESAAASEELSGQADMMKRLVSNFNLIEDNR